MTTDIHSCGPACCKKKCIEARRALLTYEQCVEFRRMACSFDDMIRAIYAAGMAQSAVQAQKPVATVKAKSDAYGGVFVHWTSLPVAGMKLYSAPTAQQAQPPAPSK